MYLNLGVVMINSVKKYWYVIALAAGGLAGAASLWLASNQSIWFDENYSILLARHSLGELLALTGVDAHPPLYYVLLQLWGNLWGWSEFALRGLTALCLGGTVVMTIVLLRRLFGAGIGLMVAPFLLLAPFILRYGYEVRMYALVALIGVTATWVLVKARESKGRNWWAAYALLVALGMYTLYMSLVIWLAHLVWLFVTTKSKKEVLKQPYIWAYVGAVALFIPYIPTFIHQMIHSALPGIGSELTFTKLANTFGIMTVYTPEWQLGGWLTLVLTAGMILFGIVYVRLWRKKEYRNGLLLLSLLVIVPLGFYALTSLPPKQPIFIERYMAHIAVYFYCLVAMVVVLGWTGNSRKYAGALGAVVILISALGVARLDMAGNLNWERMQHPMTKQMRADTTCNAGTVVVADDPYTYIDSEFYFRDCQLKFYSKENVGFQGGYAPLHDSDKRIASPSDVTTSRLVHLHWQEAAFEPGDAYHLVSTQTYDKQIVDVYER